jgi:glucosamine kinase
VENVACVVSGIAGYEGEGDAEWANDATTVEGLNADRLIVNDTEIAHFGAFSGAAGIVSIQGHGSNVFGVTEEGLKVSNAHFRHYARGGAAVLASNFHFAVLRGGWEAGEGVLVDRLCRHWNVNSPEELFALARRGWDLPAEGVRNHMAAFAERITAAALDGSELALSVCRPAALSIAEGIGLVGQCFQGQTVPVVLSGSTVRSEIMTRLVTDALAQSETKRYAIQEPQHSPLTGAVLMALRLCGVEIASLNLAFPSSSAVTPGEAVRLRSPA